MSEGAKKEPGVVRKMQQVRIYVVPGHGLVVSDPDTPPPSSETLELRVGLQAQVSRQSVLLPGQPDQPQQRLLPFFCVTEPDLPFSIPGLGEPN